jgi:hypothetical protein
MVESEFRILVLFCNKKMKCDEIDEAQGEDPYPSPSLKHIIYLIEN